MIAPTRIEVASLCVLLSACSATLGSGGENGARDAQVDTGLASGDAGLDARVFDDATPGMDASADAGVADAARSDLGSLTDADVPLPDGSVPDLGIGPGTLLYTMTFQEATIPAALTRDEVADDSLELVEAPWDATRQALRVLVRHGESWNGAGYPRSEVSPQSSTMVNRLAWNRLYRIVGAFSYAADAMLPDDGDHGIGLLITGFQLHGDDGVSPVLAFELRNGNMQLDYRPTDASVVDAMHDCGPAPLGERISYEILYRGAIDATGYLRVVVNGAVCYEESGPSNRAANPSPGYMKYGIYDPFHTVATSLVMYLDDVSYYGY